MYPSTQCPSCSSENQRKFGGELALHVPGLKGVNKNIVLAFPQILLCLDCGFAMFPLEVDALKKARQTYPDDDLSDHDTYTLAG